MSLVTRCPTCGTTFRVQAGQLSQKGGKVRCGKCAAVFDGLASLVEESAASAAPEPSPQLGLFEAAQRRAAASAIDQPVIETAVAGLSADISSPANDASVPEAAFLAEPEPRQRFSVVWTLLALLALTALAAQAIYHFRTDIWVLVPQARPYLADACAALDCEVRLPRRADLMSIESSDLQAETRRENVIVLNAVVRNRAPFPQELPWLELTLTDPADQAVVRRVLRPADYVDAARARELAAQGVAPGGEVVVRVHFDTSRVRAIGYRLYLFYP